MQNIPTAKAIEQAAKLIDQRVHQTPVITSSVLNELYNAHLFFKCENLQRTGSFKIRGATNAVAGLSDQAAARGVATHSSGNHGAALACAAQARQIPCHVVVPRGAVRCKLDNIRRYGATVVPCQPTQQARESGLASTLKKTGAEAVPPYDDPRIIAGQGTAARELFDQAGPLDALITPLGGGGLLSGSALWARHISPHTAVIGAEPSGANDAWRSLAAGKIVSDHEPDTLCDGLRGLIGQTNFRIIQRDVEEVVTVTDAAVIKAMRQLWEITKLVVEPSAATVLAAVAAAPELFAGRRVGLIISGGNVDLDDLPWN